MFVVVVLLAFGGDLAKLQSIYTPDIDGYHKAPPSGHYTPLDWPTLVKATSRGGHDDFPAVLKSLNNTQVIVSGYMYPPRSKDGSVDETPVNGLLVTQQYYAHVAPSCGLGCQNPVGVVLAEGTTLAVTDWPCRFYGTLKLDPKVFGAGQDVQIINTTVVIGR